MLKEMINKLLSVLFPFNGTVTYEPYTQDEEGIISPSVLIHTMQGVYTPNDKQVRYKK